VHVGQDDLSVDGARRIIGSERWLGVSTHNLEQVKAADKLRRTTLLLGRCLLLPAK